MRTTLTIDDGILERLKKESNEAKEPLKVTVNRILRLGIELSQPRPPRSPYKCPRLSLGYPPSVPLDKALQIAAALEDEETIHKVMIQK